MYEWEKDTYWKYDKLQEDGKVKTIANNHNDFDAKITGKYVFGVKAYFDENPEEARRLGWTKHIMHNTEKWVTWNKQTQYLVKSVKVIDAYTVEDEYHVMDKTPEMMRRDEENGGVDWIFSSSDDLIMEV